jgi:hypothetical protein
MRIAPWLLIFSLWPWAAQAGGNTSSYSRFDLDHCRQIEPGDEYVHAGTWACKGLKGLDIIVASADERDFVGFGRNGRETCAFKKTFTAFNTALSPVEWRLKNGHPIAAIQRWRVAADENGNTATWLVVNALGPEEACHVHYVSGSYPNANEQARRAADDLAEDFYCENDVPTVDSRVGPPPIDLNACRDVARE